MCGNCLLMVWWSVNCWIRVLKRIGKFGDVPAWCWLDFLNELLLMLNWLKIINDELVWSYFFYIVPSTYYLNNYMDTISIIFYKKINKYRNFFELCELWKLIYKFYKIIIFQIKSKRNYKNREIII